MPMPQPLDEKTARWQRLDARHHIHPFTDTFALNVKGVRVITRGEGVWLWDSEGNKILDGMAGLWCVQLGYGRQELVDAASEAMQTLPYYNAFFQTTHPYVVELAAALAKVTPKGLDRFVFANSGSEATDSAIKLIRYYWNLQKKPNKKIMIARDYAYHGVTLAAASLSGLKPMHAQWDLPLPGFVHIRAPYWYGQGGDLSPEEFGERCARALEEKIVELGPDNVASFSAEPVQGAGGLIIPPRGYLPEIARICRKYDVLLHFDEVITGFGRTGSWFGADTFGVTPDIMTLAKGLSSGYQPISAVALGPRLGEAIANAREELVHGFTYSGHPVAAAVALKNIEILETEGLVARVAREIGPYFRERLALLADHTLVGEVRSLGLLGAVELVEDKPSRRPYPPERGVGLICRDHCFGSGLVMRAIRDTMVLAPPLVISREEVDEAIRRARHALDLTVHDLGLRV
jgi:putrescine aminotransferase